MPCPGPRPIQILTEFLSWNNHCPRAINHKGKKVTCHYFTHPFSHLPTVEKGVENHTLFYLSPHLFHIYTLSIFSLTLPWPQPLWLSLLLYINEFKLETSCSFYFFQIWLKCDYYHQMSSLWILLWRNLADVSACDPQYPVWNSLPQILPWNNSAEPKLHNRIRLPYWRNLVCRKRNGRYSTIYAVLVGCEHWAPTWSGATARWWPTC